MEEAVRLWREASEDLATSRLEVLLHPLGDLLLVPSRPVQLRDPARREHFVRGLARRRARRRRRLHRRCLGLRSRQLRTNVA